jgi:hypothetical protein
MCAQAWRNARESASGAGPVAGWSGGAAIFVTTMVFHRAESILYIALRIAATSRSIVGILPIVTSSLRMNPAAFRGRGQKKKYREN